MVPSFRQALEVKIVRWESFRSALRGKFARHPIFRFRELKAISRCPLRLLGSFKDNLTTLFYGNVKA